MTDFSDDALVNLSRTEIVQLKEIYSKIKEADYVHTLLDVVLMSWEKLDNKTLVVTSPNNEAWKRDGSIVVFVDYGLCGVFPYSFDKNYGYIQEALLKTKRISSDVPLFFVNIHESYVSTIKDIIQAMNKKVSVEYENYLHTMNEEKAKALEFSIPKDVYCDKLTVHHAKQINDVWPHRTEDSEPTVAAWIKLNGGYGLFKQEDNEMVAWVLQGPLGHINLLQTEEQYKKKGYGKLLTQIMAKHIAENGQLPTATVLVHNEASKSLFSKLGFEIRGKSYFIFTDNL